MQLDAKACAGRERRRAVVRKSYAKHRAARIETARQYRLAHPDMYRKATRRWYGTHKEKAKAAARQKRQSNINKAREDGRRWYAEHRDQCRVSARKWRTANRAEILENRRIRRATGIEREQARRRYAADPLHDITKVLRKRARKLFAPGAAYTTAQHIAWRVAVWGNKCSYCGGPYEAIDHVIPLACGGTHWPANLRPSCRHCNSSKGTKSLSEWMAQRKRTSAQAQGA